jgi:hypothetical protein
LRLRGVKWKSDRILAGARLEGKLYVASNHWLRGRYNQVLGYTHEQAAHFCDDTWSQRLVGKSILPRTLTDEKRWVVLHRDPRDVVVSSRFHKTRRSQKTDCSLEEFIRHPRSGIAGIVWVVPEPASDGPASIG